MAANPYRRQAQGLENVPSEGPFVLVTNHYARRGLRTYHCAMFITTVIAERRPLAPAIRWVITSEWYGYRLGPIPIPVWLCLLYTSPSPRDRTRSRMPSSA